MTERRICLICNKAKTKNVDQICAKHTADEKQTILISKKLPVQTYEKKLAQLLNSFHEMGVNIPTADPFQPDEVESYKRVKKVMQKLQPEANHTIIEFPTDTESQSDITDSTDNV